MSNIINSLIAVILVSATSFVGALGLVLEDKLLNKLLISLVAFSAGSMIGAAFFHMLPEVLISQGAETTFVYLLFGFCLFFVLERILRWRHCHKEACETHQHLGWINIVGDGTHNFIDGLTIFASFLVGPALGIPVTISIIMHEIPHEMGVFGVLVYSGFSKIKAVIYNFLTGLVAVAGVIVGWLFFAQSQSLSQFVLPFAAGGFIYIAASDLIPELHKEKNLGKAVSTFVIFVAALIFMYEMKIIFE